MAKHQYYVLAKTLWQHDKWSPVAGPISKKEAQAIAEEKADNGFNEYGLQNLGRVVDTIVVSKTRMIRKFNISEYDALREIAYIRETDAENRRHQERMEPTIKEARLHNEKNAEDFFDNL